MRDLTWIRIYLINKSDWGFLSTQQLRNWWLFQLYFLKNLQGQNNFTWNDSSINHQPKHKFNIRSSNFETKMDFKIVSIYLHYISRFTRTNLFIGFIFAQSLSDENKPVSINNKLAFLSVWSSIWLLLTRNFLLIRY